MGAGLVAAGLACGIWALRSPVAPARAALPRASWIGLALPAFALAMAGVAARRRHPHRRWGLVGVVVAGVCAELARRAASSDVDGGLPRMAVPLSAVALLWVTVGGFLLAIAPERVSRAGVDVLGPWGPRRAVPDPPTGPGGVGGRWRVGAGVAVVAGLVASALAVSGSWALEHRVAVDATTAAPPGEAPPLVAPERIAWTWEQPSHGGLYPRRAVGTPGSVVAAGTGLAVDDRDGVVALDGATGEERWHYRRPGAIVSEMNASLSGEWVVAQFRPGSGGTNVPRIVALNGATGEVGLDLVATGSRNYLPTGDDAGGIVVHRGFNVDLTWITDNTLVNSGTGLSLVGYDLATGERSWEWRPPDDGCEYGLGIEHVVVGQDTVIAPARCGTADVVLVALDDRTGDERWTTAVPSLDRGLPSPTVSPTGDAVMVVEVAGEIVIDTATGEPLASRDHQQPPSGQEPPVTDDVTVGDTGLVIGRRATGPATFELLENGVTAGAVTIPDCGHDVDDDTGGYVTVADALVVACNLEAWDGPPEDQPSSVHVVPWESPDDARTIDLEPLISEGRGLVVTPHTIAVAGTFGIAVLGPG